MSILGDVARELFGMFVSDARLTLALLAMVLIAAVLIDAAGLAPLAGGVFLLAGSLSVLVVSVRREAGRKKPAADEES